MLLSRCHQLNQPPEGAFERGWEAAAEEAGVDSSGDDRAPRDRGAHLEAENVLHIGLLQ